jgi:hypothetical protein
LCENAKNVPDAKPNQLPKLFRPFLESLKNFPDFFTKQKIPSVRSSVTNFTYFSFHCEHFLQYITVQFIQWSGTHKVHNIVKYIVKDVVVHNVLLDQDVDRQCSLHYKDIYIGSDVNLFAFAGPYIEKRAQKKISPKKNLGKKKISGEFFFLGEG